MTIEHFETPLAKHPKISSWGLEPIQRVDGSAIDYDYYLARGRQARGEAVFEAIKSLFRIFVKQGVSSESKEPRHGGPASEHFRTVFN